MSDKKLLKYPLPGDIDLTEDEVFRNQEFHVFEPGKKLLPWQAYDSNWIDYSFGTINLSTTTSSLLNNRFSTSTNHILNDFNKLDVVSNNINIAKIVSTYSDTAKYTVTYNFDGTSYTYTNLLPVEGELKLDDLYEKLPFSPFRDPKEIPVHIHDFKHVTHDNSEYDMDQSRLYLNFKNNGMKYSGNLNPNELFNMSGSKYVRKTINENDEESYEIVIRNPNKELFEDVKEDKKMCEFIREFFADEIEEEVSKRVLQAVSQAVSQAVDEAKEQAMSEGREAGRAEGRVEMITTQVQKKLARGRSLEEIAEDLEEDVETIREIIAKLPV